jgi:hypothetical protein
MIRWLWACSGPRPETADPERVEVQIPGASPVTLARRISLDVRGLPPSLQEYRQVQADPEALSALVEQWLHDPRFEDRIVELYGEIYLTRTEQFPFSADDLHLSDQVAFARSLGEEPLRILARVASDDRPWTEIVTGDLTVADETLAAAFPIDRPEGEGWLESRYADGRPAAGVLSTNGFMWRYTSTASNANRKRANQASRVLLCADYLTRAIDFDRNVNLLDEGAVNDALVTNPACVSCHVSLDPLGSYFYGFWWLIEDSSIEASVYHPDREPMWEQITGIPPAYHGEPGFSLEDLGRQIASDPRFVECAVEQAFELMLRRPPVLEDRDQLTVHREAFLRGGLTLRALLRSVLTNPEYTADHTALPGAMSRKLATPDLLASQVEALTGYRWTYGGADMLGTDTSGVRTLAGGADGTTVTRVSDLPNATSVLVQQRLAEGAVAHLFAADPARLLGQADLEQAPAPEQLAELYLAVLGLEVEADSEPVAALRALYDELLAVDGQPRTAWAGVVYALLRDPELSTY